MTLIDTSVIIDFLRRKDKSKTWFYSLANSQKKLAVSIITHTELFAGKTVWQKPLAKRELTTLFKGLTLIPLTQKISQAAGKIRANSNLDLIDSIIAATTTSGKHSLATLNQKHFQKVKGLKLLKPF